MTAKTKRSPNYPANSLEDAITKVKMIYEQEHKNPTDKEVIAKHLGYNGLNGASLTLISAISKYGLLESVGPKQLKVSAAAESILYLEKGDPERVRLLKEAAFTPSLFSELRDTFEKLPSDQSLRHYLITKKEFNPNAADSVIRAYRDTLEFVNAEEELNLSSSNRGEQPVEEQIQTQPSRDINSSYPSKGNNMPTSRDAYPQYPGNTSSGYAQAGQGAFKKSYQYPVAEDCTARVEFDGDVTLEAVETLIASLKIFANILSKKKTQPQKAFNEFPTEKPDYWQGDLFEESELLEEEQ